MRVLITGGTGFIGAHIIDKLLESNNTYQILALTRQIGELCQSSKCLKWLEADLNNTELITQQLVEFNPEIVIHLAWQDIPDFSAHSSLNNLNQTMQLFQALWKTNSCKKILIPGSCFEYNSKKGICLESSFQEPKDFFTWAKLSIFNYLLLETQLRNITLGWFRLFYVYGPNQRKESLIPGVINSIKQGVIPSINTPKNANDFIYVKDIAEFFEMSIHKNFDSGIYNLGSGTATPVLDICGIIENLISSSTHLTEQLQEQTKATSQDVDFSASTDLTSKIFDWKSSTPLQDGIQSMLDDI